MFRNFPKELLIAVRITLILAVLGGLVYPLVMLGVSQVAFNSQANGSLIKNANGTVVGSQQIGQCFYETKDVSGTLTYQTTQYQGHTFYTVDPRYFQGRPSYALTTTSSGAQEVLPLSPPCNPLSSQGSNLGPSNSLLIQQVDTYAGYLHCVGIDTSGAFTAAQLQQAVTDPTHHCLSSGAGPGQHGGRRARPRPRQGAQHRRGQHHRPRPLDLRRVRRQRAPAQPGDEPGIRCATGAELTFR
jgi:K+-transporting ATPase c subunit